MAMMFGEIIKRYPLTGDDRSAQRLDRPRLRRWFDLDDWLWARLVAPVGNWRWRRGAMIKPHAAGAAYNGIAGNAELGANLRGGEFVNIPILPQQFAALERPIIAMIA
jgi:hypothetical protein